MKKVFHAMTDRILIDTNILSLKLNGVWYCQGTPTFTKLGDTNFYDFL
jgi:hypothetical protein